MLTKDEVKKELEQELIQLMYKHEKEVMEICMYKDLKDRLRKSIITVWATHLAKERFSYSEVNQSVNEIIFKDAKAPSPEHKNRHKELFEEMVDCEYYFPIRLAIKKKAMEDGLTEQEILDIDEHCHLILTAEVGNGIVDRVKSEAIFEVGKAAGTYLLLNLNHNMVNIQTYLINELIED